MRPRSTRQRIARAREGRMVNGQLVTPAADTGGAQGPRQPFGQAARVGEYQGGAIAEHLGLQPLEDPGQ